MHSLKAKLEDKFRENPATKAQLKTVCSSLSIVLGMAKNVASNSGIPALAMGLTGLQFFVDAIQKTSQNAEDVKELSERIERLSSVLNEANRVSPPVHDRINRLAITLQDISEGAKRMQSRNSVKRALAFTQDSEWLKGQIQAVSWGIQSFLVETILDMEFALNDHIRFVHHIVVGKLDQIQGVVNVGQILDVYDYDIESL
ncbi:hypothetical protein B0H14DRAFT_3559219 [Mycena olivaceomarginata]|nr:hypothetical protein B0H14DRAFT_3559219 [Mycena olivaceomarginata]